MPPKRCFTLLAILIFCKIALAQTNIAPTSPVPDPIDLAWLPKANHESPTQSLNWIHRQAPGFLDRAPDLRKQAPLSGEWQFLPLTANAAGMRVDLPHEFPSKRDYQCAWYATRFELEALPQDRLFILLNRIDLLGVVFLNGQRIGQHAGSYTPFEFEITDAVVRGSNTLAIFVQDRSAAVDGDKAYHQLGPAWLDSEYSQGRADKVLPGGFDDVPVLELRSERYFRDIFVKTSTRQQEMEIEVEFTPAPAPSRSPAATLSFEVLDWSSGRRVDLEIPSHRIDNAETTHHKIRVPWQDPKLWSPNNPHLYVLRAVLETDQGKDILDTRFGFREFWIEGTSFLLNGIPTRLRGESIYRDFHLADESHTEIFKRYKEMFGSNACRIHAYMPHGDIIRAADEAGVLLINQSAIWSVNVMFYKRGGQRFLNNTKKEFEEWARRDRNSPSVVIWDVENEMLRYNHELHLPWVSQLPDFIKPFDDTRPINFSGGGWFDPDQDMVSLHMQEHYTRIMRDWKAKGDQPLLMGEFWVGGRMEQRIPTSPEFASTRERYLAEGEIYRERILEMREIGVSGVMPFRLSLLAFDRAATDRNGKTPLRPAATYAPIKQALQAETVFVWPRQKYTSANAPLQREIVVCNDGEIAKRYTLRYGWEDAPLKEVHLRLQPAEQGRIPVKLPAPSGEQTLIAHLNSEHESIANDRLSIVPIEHSGFSIDTVIQIYRDTDLSHTLEAVGLETRSTEAIPSPDQAPDLIWIIPDGANNRELNTHRDKILDFLNAGGTLLCLKQNQAPLWFPIKFQFWSAIQTSPHTYAAMGWEGLHKDLFYSKNAPILMQEHPIFTGIENDNLHLWDPVDGRVSDDVFARPSSVNKYESGNWIPLASGTRREHVSIAELSYGKGTLLSSQLNLTENLDNPQANRLLGNMLRYLSAKTPQKRIRKVALRGALSPTELSQQLNVPIDTLQGAFASHQDLMIALNGSDLEEAKQWAAAGGTVFIASGPLASQLSGVEFDSAQAEPYLATKVGAHPLLGGVSSALFLSDSRVGVSGHFTRLPDKARVLLQGFTGKAFWRFEDAGPILFSFPHGKGEILASSLQFGPQLKASEREMLSLVLTHYGTPIENAKSGLDHVVIKKTVPITVDGVLNEWLEDMEDRFVTPYLHAHPIYLTSESIVEGPPEFDLNLSAINYLLWNEEALHIAGVVFGEERTFETGIEYGRPKTFEQEIRYGNDIIKLSVEHDRTTASVNGKPLSLDLLATSTAESKDLTDATRLQFSYILASGKIASVDNLTGNTFEIKVPWDLLKTEATDKQVRALFTLFARGSKIQMPPNASAASPKTWLQTRLGKGK
ncbi:hypothetical protein IEN85_11115 [Pelagicoccus sp. NFK12]|uniref:Beta-galactosidase n=1 Tax=Pelagicoccus enzymogenes TaxID=2773457 RepID=A0A927F8X7_9BACT|nr:glycoside hydrolase family 2 TIM barrel-domain containing protein [Pelagicoccus enzymogenes]MBD5780040.1 hypothetical protein [Pelagicoccus enzymogenes]